MNTIYPNDAHAGLRGYPETPTATRRKERR